jgi:predicted nucleic acid-binding protein
MVTQIGFVRVSSHAAIEHHVSAQEAWQKLFEIVALPSHSFWAEPPEGCKNDAFSKTVPNILTHGLVTDGYLATVAAFHGGKLATFDKQLARTFGPLAFLVGRIS